MNDYIKRKELLDELCRDNCERTYDGTCHNCRMTETIADFPAADVVEVRHGEWMSMEYQYGEDGREDKWIKKLAEQGDCAYCSLCNEFAGLNGEEEYVLSNYCPNCGARMDKEDDHEISQP